MYLIEDAGKVVTMLKSNNINCEIIGNTARIGFSEHDIDIWVKEQDTSQLREKIVTLFTPKNVLNTDWEGMYLEGTPFGNIDIFLRIDNLDYL